MVKAIANNESVLAFMRLFLPVGVSVLIAINSYMISLMRENDRRIHDLEKAVATLKGSDITGEMAVLRNKLEVVLTRIAVLETKIEHSNTR